MAKIIDINEDNVDLDGLFCKKSQKKQAGYQNKVNWIKKRFKEGLKYKMLMINEKGKQNSRGFIEYIPGEYNWRGIQADGWMVIHCLWITGKAKNQGNGTKLLNEAINDAKEQGMSGIVAMTSNKCSGLANAKIFKKAGFEKIDEAEPFFELHALSFLNNAPLPRINPIITEDIKACGKGITIIDGHQCPYIQTMIDPIEEFANKQDLPFQIKHLDNCKEAQQNGINPYGIYGIIFNQEVISHCYPRRTQEIINLIQNKL